MKLDLLVTGANVLTIDAQRPRASTFGVWNGMIVGLDDDVQGLEARETFDAGGRTVVPGFNDVHCHMSAFGQQLREIDASSMRSLDELYREIERRAADTPQDGWITGSSYDQLLLGGHPAREALDRASGGRKVMLVHHTRHMLVASSAVFDLLGAFSPEYGVPEVGFIERDDRGVPTGLVGEQAMTPFRRLRLPVAEEELVEVLSAATEHFLSEGITSASEAGIGNSPIVGSGPAELAAYQRAVESGRVRIRTEVMPTMENFHELHPAAADGYAQGLDLGARTGLGGDLLTVGPLKVFTDGALSSRTAALSENFCGTDHAGMLLFDREQLDELVGDAHVAGWQLAIHAIGDVAVDLALDLVAAARRRLPRRDARHRIEHASVVRDDQLRRFVELELIPSAQGRFVGELGDGVIAALGEERLPWTYRQRSFLDAGLIVPGSSDRPVVNGAPLLAMRDMVMRRTPSGRAFTPHEAVTPLEALRSFTLDSAFASRSERLKGSISPRKLADFVVLDADPTQVAAHEIGEITVERTYVGGDLKYER